MLRKLFILFFLFTFANLANAGEHFFTEKCSNFEFECLYKEIQNPTYVNKIYNIVCIPFYSSIIAKREPLFLKIVNGENLENRSILDEYNYKTSENELVRYI